MIQETPDVRGEKEHSLQNLNSWSNNLGMGEWIPNT